MQAEILAEPRAVVLPLNQAFETIALPVGNAAQQSLFAIYPGEAMVEYRMEPPDGGWGWVVLVGCMIVNILIPGTIKSFGVFFIEFMEAFESTRTTASWIPALCFFLYSSLSPVSSILCNRLSFRTVTIIGGLAAVLGLFLSYWATSMTYLFFSYGILLGTGAGLSFPPTVYIISTYFVRRLGLANGLCISGSAIGAILLPPLLRYIIGLYGYRNALLCMSILTMNVFVAAALYQPVERHLRRVPIQVPQVATGGAAAEGASSSMSPASSAPKVAATDQAAPSEGESKRNVDHALTTNAKPIAEDKAEMPSCSHSKEAAAATGGGAGGSGAGAGAGAGAATGAGAGAGEPPSWSKRSVQAFSKLPTGDNQGESSATKAKGSSSATASTMNVSVSDNKLVTSSSSFNYVGTPFHGSTLSFRPKEVSSGHGAVAAGNAGQALGPRRSTGRIFDLSLLRNPVYLILVASNCTNAIGYTNFLILLPAYGVSLGFDKSMAAYLLSIVSFADLIGRISGSALSDLGLIPKTWYYVGGLAMTGVALNIMPLMQSYYMLVICCGMFGLFAGIYIGITPILMGDLLGPQRLTSSFGISLFFNGILQLIGPPICGFWLERSANYKLLFHALGFILLAGASLWVMMPACRRRQLRK